MIGQAVMVAALALGSGEPVTLGIYVEFDGATYLWHNGAGPRQNFNSYLITGLDIDPDGWKGISEYVATGDGALVAAVLGEEALGFREVAATQNAVGEFGRGRIAPGERFYIGTPFRTVPPVNYIATGNQWGEEGVRYEITYDPTLIVPGDFNRDGAIDLDDFALLRDNFGTGTTRHQGDTNTDGKVDLTDFSLLKQNFGKPGSALVPEPTSWLLAALAAGGFPALRRRMRR